MKAEKKTWEEITTRCRLAASGVQAWRFAIYGIRCSPLPPGRKKHKSHGGKPPKYMQHAAAVARLRERGLNF
ncbi:MAG TPA: hypothetical protein VF669_17880 [Tepidisphaeraceae bacterium]